jgi:nicotinamide riboside transporter PnuC
MDWSVSITALSIIGVIANIYKKKWCFIIWLFTNASWCLYDFSKGLYSQSFLFFVYTLLAIWGLIKWAGDENGFNRLK